MYTSLFLGGHSFDLKQKEENRHSYAKDSTGKGKKKKICHKLQFSSLHAFDL